MRRWSLGTFAVSLCALLALSACGASQSASGSNGSGATTLNVQEKDFTITMDTSSVPVGSVTFKMTNTGPSAHNIGVTPPDAAKGQGHHGHDLKEGTVINIGQNESIMVALKPGAYQVVRTLAGHV